MRETIKLSEIAYPTSDAVCSGPACPRRLASKSAVVPIRFVVADKGKLGGEYPPLTVERQVTAFDLTEGDIPTTADLPDVFSKTGAQGALALG